MTLEQLAAAISQASMRIALASAIARTKANDPALLDDVVSLMKHKAVFSTRGIGIPPELAGALSRASRRLLTELEAVEKTLPPLQPTLAKHVDKRAAKAVKPDRHSTHYPTSRKPVSVSVPARSTGPCDITPQRPADAAASHLLTTA